ncbi:LysE family translocator [Oleiharenicola lentus]|jgi:RhtB (resistance to homoserine/threonine) family protein|uniref:LysE family translocator n=1 Tax=Oleiharenicola lentus TaxID=2508720 RepID=A0A4Q1CD19_9BACT|nr:LysE family transporter [Oleiharenicola lentus]RXK56822.1 LysE family translocator [Oleiharenicola lentus]
MNFLPEFLTIAVAHALAVASPGPDFAIVLRQSLRHGRATAIWTSLGIGCGLSIHIAYSLLGLGLVLTRSATVLTAVKWLGAAYLVWIGVQALRTKPREGDVDLASAEGAPTARAAWMTGFLVNLLNPKAALFFISLFPLAVSPATPRLVQAGYGVWMTLTTVAWFSFVAVVFTRTEVRRAFLRHGHWIDRALGAVFLGFAASLLWIS